MVVVGTATYALPGKKEADLGSHGQNHTGPNGGFIKRRSRSLSIPRDGKCPVAPSSSVKIEGVCQIRHIVVPGHLADSCDVSREGCLVMGRKAQQKWSIMRARVGSIALGVSMLIPGIQGLY